MKSSTALFDWHSMLEGASIDAIDEDIILTEHLIFSMLPEYPVKLGVTVSLICTRGTLKVNVNLRSWNLQAPCMFVVISDQVLQCEGASDDFSGQFILMSDRFLNSLFAGPQQRLPLFLSVQENPHFQMNLEEIGAITEYFTLIRKAIRISDNPYRLETVNHLTQAFFYGNGYRYHNLGSGEKKSRQEILVEQFISLAGEHFREQRGLDFYADKMQLTPKHLSKVMKETSGKTASAWIDEIVVLEARALLKSTHKTIQQISDELNFANQSFFGKYFKRHVGMSPKEYKRSG